MKFSNAEDVIGLCIIIAFFFVCIGMLKGCQYEHEENMYKLQHPAETK